MNIAIPIAYCFRSCDVKLSYHSLKLKSIDQDLLQGTYDSAIQWFF